MYTTEQARSMPGQDYSRTKRWRWLSFLMAAYDFAAICFSWFAVLWVRFDFQLSQIPADYFLAYRRFILPYAAVTILLLIAFRLYRSLWRYASMPELVRLLAVSLLSSAIHAVGITLLFRNTLQGGRMPLS